MQPQTRRRSALAALAGLAMALALPGPGLWPLVGLVPGLLRRAIAGAPSGRAFRLGWTAGFVNWSVAVAWVFIVLHRYGHLNAVLSVLAVGVMAAILALQWGLVAWAASLTPVPWRLWTLPLALAALEELQRQPPWIFPWNPAAAALTRVPSLLAPLPITGAIGLSLLVLLVASGLDGLADPDLRRPAAVVLGVSTAAWVLAGALAPRFEPAGAAVKVAAVQPDVPLEERWDPAHRDEIGERVFELTRQAIDSGAGWVVWPESAVPRILETDASYRARIEALARRRGVWLLLGSIGLDRRNDEYFNSVYAVSPAGLAPWRYDKIHLVPFGEYVPMSGWFKMLGSLVREVGAFTPGTVPMPLPGPAGPTGVAVCYEVAYPSLYAEEVRHGAAILATITNDGWYGDSAAPRQHLALAILRAAEARRYLVRAANTGISAVIDPYGAVQTHLGVGMRGVISAEVQPGRGLTPAVTCSDEIRWGVVALTVAVVLGGRLTSARSRRRGGSPAGIRGKARML